MYLLPILRPAAAEIIAFNTNQVVVVGQFEFYGGGWGRGFASPQDSQRLGAHFVRPQPPELKLTHYSSSQVTVQSSVGTAINNGGTGVSPVL
jgi:hypothetical protein